MNQSCHNFVFRLAHGDQSIVIFGRHDRTQGAPSISLDLSVEVIGVFWKERELNSSHITNTIEAHSVSPLSPTDSRERIGNAQLSFP